MITKAKNVLHLVMMNHFRTGVVSLLREDAVRGFEDTGRKGKREMNALKVPQKTEKRTCAHADVLGLYRRVMGEEQGNLE